MELSETWLSTHKTKPELQQLCLSVGITDVAHHRAWLAREYIAARNAQSVSPLAAVADQMVVEQREASMTVLKAAGFVEDPELDSDQESIRDQKILDQIEEAQSKQDLQRIWSEATEAGQHPERWTDELTKAGLGRMRVIDNMRPVGADSPFA
jgi:hypothetical protein